MGLDGLWIAFILYVVLRGVSLGLALPGLFARSVSTD
jgi:hypothetical protein